MANTLGSAVIEFGASTASLQTDVQRAVGIVDKAVADINVTINKAGSGANFNGISSQVEGLKASFASLSGIVSSVFGVGLGVGMAKQAMDIADAYQGVSNRIITTISNMGEMAAIQSSLFDVAQATGVALDSTAKTYQRLEQVIQGQGASQIDAQTQAIGLTKELNQEIMLSGANQAEAARATQDLVHGLATGTLNMRQFRGVMMQMPDLTRRIADGLGVSQTQLFAMMHAGLSTQAVLQALANQAGTIEADFNKLPVTFTRAWTVLHNAVEQYIGQAVQAGTASSVLKDAIIGIANNIGTVATGAEAVGAAMALWLGGKGLQTISGMAVTLTDMALAQGAYTTAAVKSAQADMLAATARGNAVAQTQARLESEIALRDAELSELTVQQKAIASEIALAEARERTGAYSANVLLDEERMIAMQTELTAVTAKLTAGIAAQDAAMARLVGADAAAATATAALAEAQGALAAEQKVGAVAMSGLSRAGAGLFAMIGGWPTVIIAAGAALYYLATAESDLEKQTDEVVKTTNQLNETAGNTTDAAMQAAQAQYDLSLKTQDSTKAKLDDLLALQKQSEGMAVGQTATTALAEQISELYKEENAASTASGNLAGALLKVKAIAAGNWLMGVLNPDFHVDLSSIEAAQAAIDKQVASATKLAATYGQGKAAAAQYDENLALTAAAAKYSGAELDQVTQAIKNQYAPLIAADQALDAVTAAHKGLSAAARDAAKAQREHDAEIITSGKDMQALTDYADQLANKVDDSLAGKAYADYNAAVTKANELAEKAVTDGANVNDVIAEQNVALDAAQQKWIDQTAAIGDFDTVMQKMDADYARDEQLAAMSTQQRKVAMEVEKEESQVLKEMQAIYGKNTQLTQDQIDVIKAHSAAVVANTQSIELSEQAAKDWENIWAQAGDSIAQTFSKILVEGGSLFDSLKSLAQQTVEAIIQYFAKLAVINPILNAVFGGSAGFSLLPTMANAAGSAAMSSGSSSIIGAGVDIADGANFASTAAGGTQFSIMNPSTWIAAGKSMYSGFTGMFDTSAYTMGPPTMAGSTSSFAPGYTNGFGQALGVAGAVYAGYSEYQAAGGGAGGLAGAAAYGVGTYFAGAAATTALSSGLAAGFAAIPVVGWIALAAMAINMISGGKLFGTAGKVIGGSSTTTIGPDGAELSAEYTTKGQKALFGGAVFKEHNMDVSQDAIDAANQFFDQLKTGTAAFAAEFGTTMGDIVGGTFKQTFDKNGKVTGSTTTIAGHTYSGETQDQFTEREISENEIAVLSQFDKNLSASIDQYRADADTLAAVTNALAQGEAEMQAGTKFLALGSDQSLSALLKLAQGSEQFGETIDQTLQRIEQAQASYDQFVGQFKPAATYVDDFEASLAGINAQMQQNIDQANALAKAAGAAGASETDLANIHQYAAAQAAAAIAQLETSAQSLAFNLGISNIGSLDQVNAEIQQLESQAGQGAKSVQNFGNAMQTASQQAQDAINLLLGSDSPLNDQQKLQDAIAGLKAGTVSQTAVLDIGRRLYASSQAYNDLFAMVQQYPGLQSGGASAIGTGSTGGGLSASDSQRLQELLKEQATLQAGQTLAQYQTLAQQIAEIASAKGETFQQVIDEMGIKDADLEKGLGIKSDADLNAYLAKIQAQTDSAGDNTLSIIAVLNKIYDVLSGTSDNPTRNGGPPGIPAGHDPRGAPPMTPSDIRLLGQAFGQAVSQSIAPLLARGPRNQRAPAHV